MKYEDFDLHVESLGGRDYRVSVLRSPGGEGRAEVRFPYDQLALKNRLLTLENTLLRSGGRRRSVSGLADFAGLVAAWTTVFPALDCL